MPARRPHVVAHVAVSLDGATTGFEPDVGRFYELARTWSEDVTLAGADVGAVVTLRDHTELRAVTGELDVVRGLSDSLRSQNHESANRLHTMNYVSGF